MISEDAVEKAVSIFQTCAYEGHGTAAAMRAVLTAHEANSVSPARSELERLMRGYQLECNECEQIAGKALGYPWYKDDQKNCPGATEADGVCVGEHVPSSVVAELARRYAEANSVSPDALAIAHAQIRANMEVMAEASSLITKQRDRIAELERASPPEPDALAVIEAARNAVLDERPNGGVWFWGRTLEPLADALAAYDKAKRPTPAAEALYMLDSEIPSVAGPGIYVDKDGRRIPPPAVAEDTEALVKEAKRQIERHRRAYYYATLKEITAPLIASLRKGAGT